MQKDCDDGANAFRSRRVVIIGIGAVANCIAEAILKIPSLTLVAGACRTPEKGIAFAKQFNCVWFDDAERMLEQTSPDFAIICTPSGHHLDSVRLCAKHGVNVLCEKPLEIRLDRAEEMLSVVEAAGIRLGAIFPQRFNPIHLALRDAIAAGRFGSIACISGTVPWWREDSYYAADRWQGKLSTDGGGALINQAIHTLDLVQWLLAADMPELAPWENPVEEVYADTAIRAHDSNVIEVEDTAVLTLRFRNGALGQLLAATSMYPGSLRRLLIAGRNGTAEIIEDQMLQFNFREPAPEDESIVERFAHQTQHSGGCSVPMAIHAIHHQRNIESFLRSLESGEPPELSGEQAAKAIAIIEACYESAIHRKPVKPRELNRFNAVTVPNHNEASGLSNLG